MKKTILLMALLMSALLTKAQDIGACLLGTNAEGKKCLVCVNRGSAVENSVQTYYKVDINVLSCEDMFSKASITLLGTSSMLIRQEEGKTFRYDEVKGCEEVLMDMSLEEGDVFVRPNGERLMVERTETDTDGVKIIHLKNTDNDTEDTWRSDIGSMRSGILQVDDIEGIIINCYQDNFRWVSDSSRSKYYYPEVNNDDLKQVSYCAEWIGSDTNTDIDFSFVDDSLHIKGIYCIGGGSSSMQIIQCIIDGNNIYIDISTNENYAPKYGHWGVDQYYYDLKIPGFKPGIYSLYNLMMSGGKGIQAICGDVDYRPFIEEGKVWKVGWLPIYSNGESQANIYFYFDGDTIIDGRTCKKMVYEYKEYKEEYQEMFDKLKSKFYEGAVYEADRQVLYAEQGRTKLGCLYDFSVEPGDSLTLPPYYDDYFNYVTEKKMGGVDGFKGRNWTILTSVNLEKLYGEDFNEEEYDVDFYTSANLWMEGVGSKFNPNMNLFYPFMKGNTWHLMECRIGDEVIYHNPDIIDGVNPPDDTKKRIDFTHVVKPKPKAPHQEAEAEGNQLSGAYTMRLLDLDLGTMSDTYHVTITDDTGETVYDKTVRAADVLALNIDISEWTAPSYTITFESDYEQYVGTFSPTPTSIGLPPTPTQIEKDGIIYDLQGRRVTTPTKGLYIKNGKKYLKR